MEQIKRKRGRPRKNPLPEEINTLVEETKVLSEAQQGLSQAINDYKQLEFESTIQNDQLWDVPLGAPIEFFDANLSYEITGYRPITDTQGLDFNPSWFTEARDTYKRTGHYCSYRFKSKPYNDFWKEQYRRCRDGYTVNGYTITGDNYFFLNFYTLPLVDKNKKSGSGTNDDFPTFFVSQYTFFHYYEMAKRLHLHCALMKARSIGFSEINAAIATNMFITIRQSFTIITCYDDLKLKRTYRKFTHALTFLDSKTDGGMFRLRQLEDSALTKKSGRWENINGQKVASGFQSTVSGVNGKDPGNIRGDRVDLIIYDEAGSWPDLTTAVIQGQELVEVQGIPRGIMMFGGTGGDKGKNLEGLRTIYYEPQAFKVLPYRHNYSQTGETVITAFFIPYFAQSLDPDFMDSRGVCNIKKFKEFLQQERNQLAKIPAEYVKKCAERCWNAEEAFNLEGDNKFNKINIAEQLARIRALKQCPPIERGFLEYKYKEGAHIESNIDGFKWIPNQKSQLRILEHPIWTLQEKKDEEGKVIWRPPSEKINNLYVIGIDGIDIGAAQTSENTKSPSDFCLTVYKRAYGLQEPQFVAIYKDRPNDVRECYKIAIRLAQYYNAIINIEATRQGIIPYARERKLLKLFMKRPRATLSDAIRNTNKQYGTPATPAIIDHQTDLIADYINDYYHLLWFEDMLDEFNRYTDENKRKFDIVAAVAMALLADEELQGVVPKIVETVQNNWETIGYYTDQNGNRRYGVIPKQNNQILSNNNFGEVYDDNRIRTSNTKLYQGYI